MCGRFAYHGTKDELEARFGLEGAPDIPPRYNVAPQTDIAVVRDGQCVLLRWGLVPFWSRDPKTACHMINARAETVAEKPAFREAFTRRRCLIPASGFYEWKKTPQGKQPYYIRMADGELFAFAGLWEHWAGRGEHEGEVLQTCTIITTEANELCAGIDDRMPVIVPPADYEAWLAHPRQDLLRPYPADEMDAYPVSPRVNSPKNDDAGLIEP